MNPTYLDSGWSSGSVMKTQRRAPSRWSIPSRGRRRGSAATRKFLNFSSARAPARRQAVSRSARAENSPACRATADRTREQKRSRSAALPSAGERGIPHVPLARRRVIEHHLLQRGLVDERMDARGLAGVLLCALLVSQVHAAEGLGGANHFMSRRLDAVTRAREITSELLPVPASGCRLAPPDDRLQPVGGRIRRRWRSLLGEAAQTLLGRYLQGRTASGRLHGGRRPLPRVRCAEPIGRLLMEIGQALLREAVERPHRVIGPGAAIRGQPRLLMAEERSQVLGVHRGRHFRQQQSWGLCLQYGDLQSMFGQHLCGARALDFGTGPGDGQAHQDLRKIRGVGKRRGVQSGPPQGREEPPLAELPFLETNVELHVHGLVDQALSKGQDHLQEQVRHQAMMRFEAGAR